MLISGIAHPIIATLLPTKYRNYFLYGTAGIKLGLVIHNNSIGLGLGVMF